MPTPPSSRPSSQGPARQPTATAGGTPSADTDSIRRWCWPGSEWCEIPPLQQAVTGRPRLSSVAEHSGEASESGALAVSPSSGCAAMLGRNEVKAVPSSCAIELSTLACSCAGACSCRQAPASEPCCPVTRQDSGSTSCCQPEDAASGSSDSTQAAAQAACDQAEQASPPGPALQVRQDHCKGASRLKVPPGQSFSAGGTVLSPTSAVQRKAAFFEALASGTPPQPCLVSCLLPLACQLRLTVAPVALCIAIAGVTGLPAASAGSCWIRHAPAGLCTYPHCSARPARRAALCKLPLPTTCHVCMAICCCTFLNAYAALSLPHICWPPDAESHGGSCTGCPGQQWPCSLPRVFGGGAG